MEGIPEFVIAGVPLVVVVFALVEEVKAWGVQGKILRAVALALGLIFAILFQMASAPPVGLMAWLTVVVVGLIYGLTASGAYNFLDSRFPAK
jgi:hypothetical protein